MLLLTSNLIATYSVTLMVLIAILLFSFKVAKTEKELQKPAQVLIAIILIAIVAIGVQMYKMI